KPEQEPYVDPAAEHLKENGHSLQRSLALLNSGYIDQAVERGVKRVRDSAGRRIGAPHIERLYLATLSRKPDANELARLTKVLESQDDKNKGLEDVLWILLNSAEFATNH